MRRSDSEAIESALEEVPEEARALAQQLLRENGEDADLWAYLAECETELGDHDAALKAWGHYITLDPHWPGAYTARAELFADRGDLKAASTELFLAREIADEDPRILRGEALVAEIRGEFDDADDLYEEAEHLDVLSPSPPRLSREALQAALQRAHRGGGSVVIEEMPSSAIPDGMLRLVDIASDGAATVYIRNLEREFDREASVMDIVEAYESEISGD